MTIYKRLSRRSRLALVLAVYAASVLTLAPIIERLGVSGLWYCQDRLDAGSYTYVNARAELADPVNVLWIADKTGY